jgi:phosphoglycerate kinase
LDVPVSDGKITNDARLRSSLPTIQHLISKGAKVILCGHLGTPSGKGYEAAHSLAPVAAQLSALLAKNVALVPDCIGISVQRAVSEMNPGDVILLENVRFYAEEEANDAHFALQLSRNADVYVNDAFAASRGATASTTGVSAQVTPAVSGKSLHQELSFGNKLLHNPARPFIAVVGDNKAHTEGSAGREEMAELEALVEMADVLVLAGSIAAPFLKARGLETGEFSSFVVTNSPYTRSTLQRLGFTIIAERFS